jgi:hypothetical protein
MLPDGVRSVAVLRNLNDTIECRFGQEWVRALGRYEMGETLKVRGKIKGDSRPSDTATLAPATANLRPCAPSSGNPENWRRIGERPEWAKLRRDSVAAKHAERALNRT